MKQIPLLLMINSLILFPIMLPLTENKILELHLDTFNSKRSYFLSSESAQGTFSENGKEIYFVYKGSYKKGDLYYFPDTNIVQLEEVSFPKSWNTIYETEKIVKVLCGNFLFGQLKQDKTDVTKYFS